MTLLPTHYPIIPKPPRRPGIRLTFPSHRTLPRPTSGPLPQQPRPARLIRAESPHPTPIPGRPDRKYQLSPPWSGGAGGPTHAAHAAHATHARPPSDQETSEDNYYPTDILILFLRPSTPGIDTLIPPAILLT
ncbi:hypothetical protein FAIPA1_50064 [Frankia sp. AiPs1]